MGRLEWDRPSLTIRTEFFKPEKGRYLHPQWDAEDTSHRVNRPISHWEAARIQGFPDDFVWAGSKIEIARQIGNAVPIGLARALAGHVRHEILGV
jgi:DNA (cytosine-5)-methyltransferase 1